MSDNEKYFTKLVNGDLAIKTLVQNGSIISEDKKDPKRYVTALVQTANGKELCVKTIDIGGSDNVKKPTIVEDTTSTSITLAEAKANTIYKYGTLSSLTITENETSDEEILIYFTSGATCTVSFPNTLQWVNEDILDPDANTKYVISIINNIAAYGSYN